MKKKKIYAKTKINVKLMPLPLKLSNINNQKRDTKINKSPKKENKNIPCETRIKSNSTKVNVNSKAKITPKRLNTINLINNNINILYDWNILLNNKIPEVYYKKSAYKKLSINNFKTEENIPNNPVILLDLPENQIKKYFYRKSLLQEKPKTAKLRTLSPSLLKNIESIKNKIKYNLNILPQKKDFITETDNILEKNYNLNHQNSSHKINAMSINSPRDPHQNFYYSKEINDYYKRDIKSLAKMMPSLQAKIKISNKKLSQEIVNLKYKKVSDKKILKNFLENDQKVFKVQDLIIAGIRNNPVRLLKNLYKMKHPNYKKIKSDMKMFYKTMKPIGEQEGEIDYTKNERWRTSSEIKKLRYEYKRYHTLENQRNDDKSNLILSYYKVTDPDIKYFNRLVKKYNALIKSNDIDINNNIYFNQNIKLKLDKITETENEKNYEFFRDKLFPNDTNKSIDINKYNNYFITETTKNTIV